MMSELIPPSSEASAIRPRPARRRQSSPQVRSIAQLIRRFKAISTST